MMLFTGTTSEHQEKNCHNPNDNKTQHNLSHNNNNNNNKNSNINNNNNNSSLRSVGETFVDYN